MKHIPNILSGLRIVMIPFFIWQMLVGNTLAAGLILVASGLTDTLDGNLARHFGWVSDLGKVLDPVADKLTQTAVSVCLMIRIPELWFFFAILIIKDLIMRFPNIPRAVPSALLLLAVGCAIAAGLLYLPEYKRYKAKRDQNPKK